MGISIDLYKFEYTKLVNKLMNVDGINDKMKLKMILSECGEIINDTYLILSNQYYEEGNPFYSVAELIDSAFEIEDSFDIFLLERKYAKDYVNVESVAEKLDIELPC